MSRGGPHHPARHADRAPPLDRRRLLRSVACEPRVSRRERRLARVEASVARLRLIIAMTANRRIRRRSIALCVVACAACPPACGQSPPAPDETATTSGAATQATTATTTTTATATSANAASAGASKGAPVAGTVTLLTGDRVIVTRSGSQPLVRIEPGAGRTRIAFAM